MVKNKLYNFRTLKKHSKNNAQQNNTCLKINGLTIFNKQTKQYVLQNVSLEIKNQQVIYLVGPNGIGKSLFLKTIAGVIKDLDEQDIFDISGHIFFNKKNITKASASKRAIMGIFYVWQTPPAIPELKVIDYLLALGATKKQVNDLLKLVGLPLDILQKPLNLDMSGGQIKRLEVISLLILKPKLLLLDELDSGLDVKSEKLLFFNVLNNYIKENKACAIVVSHNLRIKKYLQPSEVYKLEDYKLKGPYLADWLNTYEAV